DHERWQRDGRSEGDDQDARALEALAQPVGDIAAQQHTRQAAKNSDDADHERLRGVVEVKWPLGVSEIERQKEQRWRRDDKVDGLNDDDNPHCLDRERLVDLLKEAVETALEFHGRMLVRVSRFSASIRLMALMLF